MPKKPLVLLVDDDIDLIEVNKAVLEASGYRVAAAFNGQEGLAAAKKLHPAVIVLDVMMDYQTEGFHVTYDLRQDPHLKKTPIIMLTAINKEDFIGRFQPDPTWLPVDQLFDKPIAPQRLLEEVRKALGK
jgi:CheY-like chemotaxis protein